MSTPTSVNRRLAVVVTVLAVAGCGGGGGDASPTVDVGTAERVGSASANSDVSQANFPDWSSRLARLVASTAGSSLAGGSAASRASPAAWHGAQRARALAVQIVGRKQPLATGTGTEPCPVSGSITVTANDANNNRVLDAGDSIVIDSSNCVSAVGDPAVNGRMTLVVNVAEVSGGTLVGLDASGTVSSFSVAGVVSLNGNFRFKEAPSGAPEYDLFRFSYEGLTAATPTETVTYDFDLYGKTPLVAGVGEQVVFQGSIAIGGDTYKLSQASIDMFVTAPGAELPQQGSLALLDAAGDRLVLTAKPGRLVDVVFYAGTAPSTPVVSLTNQDWNTLAFGP
jgi:hypothetical protein